MSGSGLVFNLIESGKEPSGTCVVAKSFADVVEAVDISRCEDLNRSNLLCAKLFALCDRGIDIGDCIALAPTATELATLLPWLEQQDADPGWPAHVRLTLTDLGNRLDHVF